MGAAGHHVVASTFWRCTGQHRRFDFVKLIIIHVTSQIRTHSRTKQQALCAVWPTQIDIAITQLGFFVDLNHAIHWNRRGFGCIQNLQLETQHLDRAGVHV